MNQISEQETFDQEVAERLYEFLKRKPKRLSLIERLTRQLHKTEMNYLAAAGKLTAERIDSLDEERCKCLGKMKRFWYKEPKQ